MEFEGRWEGESTRSAYLFFHRSDVDDVSIDVYLDETGRGLTGNLALVIDLAPLGTFGDPAGALSDFRRLATNEMPRGFAAPLTLRLRLPDGPTDPAQAEVEVRFKLTVPSRVIAAGGQEIRSLVVDTVTAFERILASQALVRYRSGG